MKNEVELIDECLKLLSDIILKCRKRMPSEVVRIEEIQNLLFEYVEDNFTGEY